MSTRKVTALILVLCICGQVRVASGQSSQPTTEPAGTLITGLPAEAWLNTAQGPEAEYLKGRLWILAVVEPWAPSTHKSLAGLQGLHDRWDDRGVAIIALTVESAETTRKEIPTGRLSLPIGCSSPLPFLLSLEPLPVVHLVGPEGRIIWSGPVDRVEATLERHYRNMTPDGLSPERAEALQKMLDRANSSLKQKRFFEAAGCALIVARSAPKSHPLHERAEALLAKLRQHAGSQLARARDLLRQGKYAEAYDLLSEVAEQFFETREGSEALELLQKVRNDERAWSVVMLHRDEQAAERAMDLAGKARAEGHLTEALRCYRIVTEVYPHTNVAQQARAAIRKLQSDPKTAAALAEQRAWPDAAVLQALARRYAQLGRYDLARRYYERIGAAYPGTTYAIDARKALATMPAGRQTTTAPASTSRPAR